MQSIYQQLAVLQKWTINQVTSGKQPIHPNWWWSSKQSIYYYTSHACRQAGWVFSSHWLHLSIIV